MTHNTQSSYITSTTGHAASWIAAEPAADQSVELDQTDLAKRVSILVFNPGINWSIQSALRFP
jgi:hypothetical protein